MTPDVTTLPSGLRVASVTMPHLHSVSLSISVVAGAMDEPAELNGLAHLLEHMAFKGTSKRSARDIAEEVEAVGGDLNAFTGRNQTSYQARLLSEYLPLGVDVLSDLLCDSTFEEEELAREKGVVLQEIGASEDAPDDIVFDMFQEAAFPGQPMGRPILGRAENLKHAGRDELKSFMGSLYDAPHMIVTAAGDVDHAQLVDLAANHLGSLPTTRTAPTPALPIYAGGDARSDKKLEQAHLLFGFEAPKAAADGYYETWLMNEIFGGGMSSRLFQDIRETRGLAYSVYSMYRAYPNSGMVMIYAGTAGEDAQEVASRSAANLHDMAAHITDAELSRAKAQVKSAVLMGLERPGSIADGLAGDLLHLGRWVPPEEVISKVDALGISDLKAAAANLLTSPLTVATIGPTSGLETYDALAARFGTPQPLIPR